MFTNYIEALSKEIAGIGAEAKYLLVKMLYDKSWTTVSIHSTRLLAELCDMSVKATQKALFELEDNGLIEVKTRETSSRKKTLRTISLILDRRVMEYMDDDANHPRPKRRKPSTGLPIPSIAHLPLIDKLLDEAFPWRAGKAIRSDAGTIAIAPHPKSKRISIRQRLTLCILLRYADQRGTVRNLSKSELARLTGISHTLVTYQIDQLISNGYIQSAVPGISGPGFLKRAKGAYFINLDHPDFHTPQTARLTIMATLPEAHWRLGSQALKDTFRTATAAVTITHLEEDLVMTSVYRKENELNWLGKLADDETLKAMHFAIPWQHVEKTKNFEQYLQLKIDEYATLLLNKYFNAIGEISQIEEKAVFGNPDEFGIRSTLSEIIMEDLFRYELRKYGTRERPVKQRKKFTSIASIFFFAALQLANTAKAFFKLATKYSEVTTAKFLILTNNNSKDEDNNKTIHIECFELSTMQPRTIQCSLDDENNEIASSTFEFKYLT